MDFKKLQELVSKHKDNPELLSDLSGLGLMPEGFDFDAEGAEATFNEWSKAKAGSPEAAPAAAGADPDPIESAVATAIDRRSMSSDQRRIVDDKARRDHIGLIFDDMNYRNSPEHQAKLARNASGQTFDTKMDKSFGTADRDTASGGKGWGDMSAAERRGVLLDQVARKKGFASAADRTAYQKEQEIDERTKRLAEIEGILRASGQLSGEVKVTNPNGDTDYLSTDKTRFAGPSFWKKKINPESPSVQR